MASDPDDLFALETRDRDDQRVQSVTEFTQRVKTLLENSLRAGWVRGEVSNLRVQASGHIYFSLKDAGAQLSAVLFRGDAARQTVKLRNGQQIVVYGAISVYEARGQYQLIVRAVIEDGVGRLQHEFEALKRRLADEGFFDAARKKPLPLIPATIGFITSPTGAAVQDFIRILQRRGWRGRLVVLPAKVQGDGAAAEIAAMLRGAESLGIFDLLVIGRGGGSLEDLWAFNEEILVRAIAACRVSTISAVGHEIDFTLCDFVADVRAETPSGAAELISSRYLDAQERMRRAGRSLGDELSRLIEEAAGRLAHARSRLRLLTPTAQIERHNLRLDDFSNRLRSALQHAHQHKCAQLAEARTALEKHSPELRVQRESHRLLEIWKRLQAASPASVLKRGFVIVRDESGRPLVKRGDLSARQRVSLEFGDGETQARVE
jgi:exodeoxyribonuclease VII large subunit